MQLNAYFVPQSDTELACDLYIGLGSTSPGFLEGSILKRPHPVVVHLCGDGGSVFGCYDGHWNPSNRCSCAE